MKHSLLLISVALVAACAAPAVLAQVPLKAKPDPIAEQCALVTSHVTTNIASQRLLEAASIRIAEPINRACTTAGRIMVRMTTVPLRSKVARRHGAESGMFSIA